MKWLEREKIKDDIETKNHKNKIIAEMMGMSKKDIFPPKQKETIWTRLRKMFLK
jgi:hypothetical protein